MAANIELKYCIDNYVKDTTEPYNNKVNIYACEQIHVYNIITQVTQKGIKCR